jgi:HSP20 family molecular chaperone IbpA
MSLIPHGFFSRSDFDNQWLPHSLSHFDAFDELDHAVGRDLHWLQRPSSFFEPQPPVPKVPEKYRIQVSVAGYKPESLKVEFKNNKLNVSGHEEYKNSDDDYSIKEFQKSYELPNRAEVSKMATFFAGGHLVIEIPLKKEIHAQGDLFPRVVDSKDGHGKEVAMTCVVPNNIHPEKVHITCKDRDLIIKAEDKVESKDSMTKFYYYKRCTLPDNTDYRNLKCHFEQNNLLINAPINPELKHNLRHAPIEYKPETLIRSIGAPATKGGQLIK